MNKELEQEILSFQKATWPNATIEAIEKKFHEEEREAHVEVFYRKDRHAAGLEIADYFIMATRWLDHYGLSITDCIAEKLAIIKGREYGPEMADGDREKIEYCDCHGSGGSYLIGDIWYYQDCNKAKI